jgi:transposase InsO family protein
LSEAGIEPLVGSRGDSYDNALAETINGLYKAELIHRRALWNGCLGLTTTDCLSRLGTFHLPKLKTITVGNLPTKPPQRIDLNQLTTRGDSVTQTGFLSDVLRRLHFVTDL